MLDPGPNLAVTTEMQKEAVLFAATADSGSPCGAMVIISDPTYVEP
jgi:hypothetical protein